MSRAVLNLCYLASGTDDTVWEYDTHPWDVAAGIVIARAAGADITDVTVIRTGSSSMPLDGRIAGIEWVSSPSAALPPQGRNRQSPVR